MLQHKASSSVVEVEPSRGDDEPRGELAAPSRRRAPCCDGGSSAARRTRWRSALAFWLFGCLNNIVYVIMNAGAKSISAGGVGIVYACGIAPSILVTATLPSWFHLVSYSTRIWLVALFNVACLLCVGLSSQLVVQLVGVCLGAFGSSLGEASFLGYTARFPSKGQAEIAAWSSGTGFAGIAGYAWVMLFGQAIALPFSAVSLTGLVIPAVWLLVFHCLMVTPEQAHLAAVEEGGGVAEEDAKDAQQQQQQQQQDDEPWGFKEKAVFIATRLWPYGLPLFSVYFAEYAMQAGAWAAIGVPYTSTAARGRMYTLLGWMYQTGVFISRSSGNLLTVSRLQLWIMPLLQIAFLVFFVLDATYHFWMDLGLLFPALCTGLLGGAVYVHGYMLLSREIEPHRREFAMTALVIANAMGILSSDIAGIFIQGCLYAVNEIVDCSAETQTCTAPTYTCGYSFDTTYNATLL